MDTQYRAGQLKDSKNLSAMRGFLLRKTYYNGIIVSILMLKVRFKKTGKTTEVTRNEAHDLVDAGVAEIYTPKAKAGYMTRKMSTEQTKTK